MRISSQILEIDLALYVGKIGKPHRENFHLSWERVPFTIPCGSGSLKLLVANACLKIYKSNHQTMGKLWQSKGAGQAEQAIARLGLARQIHLTGALNQAAVRSHFALADIFVLPSLAEGIPVVLMEAMSCGVSCVSTPVNGIPELIAHERTGLLATPGDVDALTLQLRCLIVEPKFRIPDPV